MNANTLLKLIERGAVLKSRWKPRTIGKPKKLHILSGTGYQLQVQKSTIDALIYRRKIRVILWSGGNVDYQLWN